MRELVQCGREFNIISRIIDNATDCFVTNVEDDSFSVKLRLKGVYEKGESVEMFTATPKGRLYFETVVKDVSDDTVTVWFPIVYRYLQRREYSRVGTDKAVEFVHNGEIIEAKISDISAGGLKVVTKTPLQLLTEYSTELEIENSKIKTTFEPVRTEVCDEGYIASGRFKNLDNNDRIALVQYCFIKQAENITL